MRLFSTEQISKYHPDKYADQISDAVLDACLAADKRSRVACETLVKGDTVILAGEITTGAAVDYEKIAASVGKKLNYNVKRVEQLITQQSQQIAHGVDGGKALGAGDQGIMYGFACNETASLLPFGFDLANKIIAEIENDVQTNHFTIFKGDAKCQVTVDLDAPRTMESVKKILVSVCHTEDADWRKVTGVVNEILNRLGVPVYVGRTINPAGAWTLGGPAADCGLTGRKIVCDQYGGFCPVGGGAFSGKDPTKVDRSAAYMARRIAADLLRLYGLKRCEVQLGYAIGKAEPMSVNVTSDKPDEDLYFVKEVTQNYDLTPAGIIRELDLLNKKYEKIAEGCHFRQGGGL